MLGAGNQKKNKTHSQFSNDIDKPMRLQQLRGGILIGLQASIFTLSNHPSCGWDNLSEMKKMIIFFLCLKFVFDSLFKLVSRI